MSDQGTAGAAGTNTTAPAAVVPPGAPAGTPSVPTQPAAGEEFRNMSPEQFKARLAETADAGRKAALKELGVENLDAAKQLLADAKKRAEADMTEQQKATARIAELEPLARRASVQDAVLKQTAEQQLGTLPESTRKFIEATTSADDPVARLTAINAARAHGLGAAPAGSAPPAPPAPPNPSTTLAPGGPATPPAVGTASKYQEWQALREKGQTIRAANFYKTHTSAIEASRPKS
jgi:hypothetical protein